MKSEYLKKLDSDRKKNSRIASLKNMSPYIEKIKEKYPNEDPFKVVEANSINSLGSGATYNVMIWMKENELFEGEEHAIITANRLYNRSMQEIYEEDELISKSKNFGAIGNRLEFYKK